MQYSEYSLSLCISVYVFLLSSSLKYLLVSGTFHSLYSRFHFLFSCLVVVVSVVFPWWFHIPLFFCCFLVAFLLFSYSPPPPFFMPFPYHGDVMVLLWCFHGDIHTVFS